MTRERRHSHGQDSVRLAVIVLFGGQVLAAAGALLVNLLASRVLAPAPRGDLAFALQISYFLSVFAMMGLERPFMAARNGDFNSEFRIFSRMLLPGALAIVPIVVLVTAFSPFSTSWLWSGALTIAVYVVLNSLVLAVRVSYVASGNWRKFAVNAFSSQIVIGIGAIALFVMEITDPVVWMMVYTLSAVPSLVLLGLAFRNGPPTNPPTSTERRSLRKRGWKLLPGVLSNRAMQRSDRLLLPVLGTSADLGLYVTVVTVLEMAAWPVQQWVDASLRRWSKKADLSGRMLSKLLFQSLLLLIMMSSLLGLAAYVMIVALLPEPYMAATAAILPLAIASIIYGITRVQQGVLIAFGAEGKVTAVEMFGTGFSLVSYVVLIPSYGMLGAAYGYLAGSTACVIAATIALFRLKKEREKDDAV